MKRKCIAIAKKAMVWALAASMLVATPLTASAAGLRGVYKVEDGWGEDVGKPAPGDTRTGTVTSTGTKTGILDSDSKLLGIVLNETNVNMTMRGGYKVDEPVRFGLSVDFVWNDGMEDQELEAKLKKQLTWKSGDNSIVSLSNPNKNGVLDEMNLVAKSGGKTTVTVSLDDYTNNIHYTTTANVNVKQIATDLIWDKEALQADAYEGVSLNLNEYLTKDPITATDNVTYEIVKDTNKSATLKNGVLKLKTKKADKEVTVVAIGEEVKKQVTIKINKAVPATKVEIRKVGETDTKTKYDWLVNEAGDGDKNGQKFEVVLRTKDDSGITKDTADRATKCTDKITWSSKKPAIVEVAGTGKGDEVTLIARSAGTAQITAQASSGKKGTINVTVKANLTGLSIYVDTEDNQSGKELYSGQSIKLGSVQKFAENGSDNFTDAGLTWQFVDDDAAMLRQMKKVATINAKTGVLTIKPDVEVEGGTKIIKVRAKNAKAVSKPSDTKYYHRAKAISSSNDLTFNLTQMDIRSINVYDSSVSQNNGVIASAINNGSSVKTNKGTPVTIALDSSRTYKVVATALINDQEVTEFEDGTPIATTLNWASSSEKVATATRNDDGRGTVKGIKKGSSTITVSGATKKSNGRNVAIKATFKATVNAPTKSLVLSTKNSAIAGTGKAQTIAIKAALDKGTTSKAREIQWTVRKVGDVLPTGITITGGKLKFAKVSGSVTYNVGDTFIVTATIPSAGVQASMSLKVVEPSKKVQFVKSDNSEEKETTITKSAEAESFNIYTKVQATNNNWNVATPDNNVAPVTYTVSKSGIVQLVGNKVTPIKKGTVKIKATTADGKTANLTIKITD